MPEQKMRAVLIKGGKSDKAEDLYIGEVTKPTLKNGEVLVKVKAFGINRMDIMQRQGHYPLPPGVTEILGVEFSGIIDELSADTGNYKWKKGDEVFGLAYGGAYAEYIAVNAGMIVSKPKALSWEQAAGIPENWLTAFQALFLIGDMQKGESVLIHAGASGVGIAANQLAKVFGAERVITTAGSDKKLERLKELGATNGINYHNQDFAEEVKKITDGKGVDLTIDFIGASYWEKNLQALGRDGRLVLLGLMGGDISQTDIKQILYKRLRIQGTTLRSRTIEYQTNLLRRFEKEALDKLIGTTAHGESHGLDLVIHKVAPWTEIAEIHKEMEGGHNTGKMVCVIDG